MTLKGPETDAGDYLFARLNEKGLGFFFLLLS